MADVIQIEPQFLDGILKICAVRIIDLRPSSDSGSDKVAQMIVRNLLFVDLGALDPLRAWSNEAHLASENIPKLGQFIEAALAEEGTESGDAMVANARVDVAFGRFAHSAKLPHGEDAPAESNPRLAEDCRTAAFQANGGGDQHE